MHGTGYLRVEVESLQCVDGCRVLCGVVMENRGHAHRKRGGFHHCLVVGVVEALCAVYNYYSQNRRLQVVVTVTVAAIVR